MVRAGAREERSRERWGEWEWDGRERAAIIVTALAGGGTGGRRREAVAARAGGARI